MKKHMPTSRNLFIVILLMMPIVIFSCNNDDEPAGVELYQGSWNGTYSGDVDIGTWAVEIDDRGNISGTATSTVMSMDYGLTGTVNSEGDFLATTGSATTGTTFTGSLTASNGQGTWENTQGGISGTWSGTKQGDGGNGISFLIYIVSPTPRRNLANKVIVMRKGTTAMLYGSSARPEEVIYHLLQQVFLSLLLID